MAWQQPKYSRSEVNRAGKLLMKSADAADLARARVVMSNWRSAHGWPLNALAATLRGRARKVSSKCIIAQRLKRLVSIENKLLRRPETRATQIQDIGGCRVIAPSMREVLAIQQLYAEGRSLVFELQRVDNYIAVPKVTGYRSLHVVYRYASEKHPEWENMRVELQIRSQLQHAWATAVEAVSFFLGQDLKAGEGSPDWLRFFLLSAHLIAEVEKCPGVPNISDTASHYRAELRELWEGLNVGVLLSGWAQSFNMMSGDGELSHSWKFILDMDVQERTVHVIGFGRNQEELAANEYAQLEFAHADNPDRHVVLVAAESVQQLRRAYPGFFADTLAFRRTVLRALKNG